MNLKGMAVFLVMLFTSPSTYALNFHDPKELSYCANSISREPSLQKLAEKVTQLLTSYSQSYPDQIDLDQARVPLFICTVFNGSSGIDADPDIQGDGLPWYAVQGMRFLGIKKLMAVGRDSQSGMGPFIKSLLDILSTVDAFPSLDFSPSSPNPFNIGSILQFATEFSFEGETPEGWTVLNITTSCDRDCNVPLDNLNSKGSLLKLDAIKLKKHLQFSFYTGKDVETFKGRVQKVMADHFYYNELKKPLRANLSQASYYDFLQKSQFFNGPIDLRIEGIEFSVRYLMMPATMSPKEVWVFPSQNDAAILTLFNGALSKVIHTQALLAESFLENQSK